MNLYAALASGFQEFIKEAICKENINRCIHPIKAGILKYTSKREEIEV